MESVLQCQPLKHNAITVNVDCDFDAWCYNFGVALFLKIYMPVYRMRIHKIHVFELCI